MGWKVNFMFWAKEQGVRVIFTEFIMWQASEVIILHKFYEVDVFISLFTCAYGSQLNVLLIFFSFCQESLLYYRKAYFYQLKF